MFLQEFLSLVLGLRWPIMVGLNYNLWQGQMHQQDSPIGYIRLV